MPLAPLRRSISVPLHISRPYSVAIDSHVGSLVPELRHNAANAGGRIVRDAAAVTCRKEMTKSREDGITYV